MHVCKFTDLVVLVSHSFVTILLLVLSYKCSCSVLFVLVLFLLKLVHPVLIFYADEI